LSLSLAWPWSWGAFAEWVEKIKSETLLRLPGQTMTSAQKLGSIAVCSLQVLALGSSAVTTERGVSR